MCTVVYHKFFCSNYLISSGIKISRNASSMATLCMNVTKTEFRLYLIPFVLTGECLKTLWWISQGGFLFHSCSREGKGNQSYWVSIISTNCCILMCRMLLRVRIHLSCQVFISRTWTLQQWLQRNSETAVVCLTLNFGHKALAKYK